nr:PREDICTED: putative lysine-specific demethylase JMJ16 isoform X3 [Daucus carota subsp. sativus]
MTHGFHILLASLSFFFFFVKLKIFFPVLEEKQADTSFEPMENPSINDTVEKQSVPPGFVSLTSFTLKRLRDNQDSYSPKHDGIEHHQKTTSTGTASDIIETPKYKKNPGARPWILYNQPSHDVEEFESEQIPTNHESNPSLPKGVLRCGDCLKVTASWLPEAARIPVLKEASVFRPTEEEFKDTLKYVAKIRPKAEIYGICRIVPPPSWKPPELLKAKKKWVTEKFSTYIQEVDELKDRCSKSRLQKISSDLKSKTRTALRKGMEYSVGGCDGGTDEFECSDEGFEFDRGPNLTLENFKRYADHFKEHYFCKKHKAPDVDADLTLLPAEYTPEVKDIEGEYWRIIENPTAKIEVLCCTDLDSRTFGSGFPLSSNPIETKIHLKYIESGWNLNNTAKLPGSLLAFENHNTSATLVPRLHFGMCLSSHCWAIQLSLSELESEGIPVYRCVQLPREFLLIFPGAYYSGIDSGFNCSEAVNFAPFDWLPYGQNIVELYSERSRKTSVSHDKLLLCSAIKAVKALWKLTMKNKKNSAHILRWTRVCGKDGILTKAFKSRLRQECRRREYFCNSSPFQEMEKDFDSTIKRECIICLYDLHLSAASCPCSPGKYTCLQHAKQLCSCSWSDRVFYCRYKIHDLILLGDALEGRAGAVYKWASENLKMHIDSGVPYDGSPRASVLDNFVKAKHTEPKEHNSSAGPASDKLKGGGNITSGTITSKSAMNVTSPLQQTLPSTISLNNSGAVHASKTVDPKISSKGKEPFLSTSVDNPHAVIGLTSSAQTPLSQIFRNKQVAEQSPSPYQNNVIVLSDDED